MGASFDVEAPFCPSPENARRLPGRGSLAKRGPGQTGGGGQALPSAMRPDNSIHLPCSASLAVRPAIDWCNVQAGYRRAGRGIRERTCCQSRNWQARFGAPAFYPARFCRNVSNRKVSSG